MLDPQAAIASAQSALSATAAALAAGPVAAATQGVAAIPGGEQVLAIGGTAIASGAAMEHLLEQFVMQKCPQAVKPYVPFVIAVGGGTYAGMAAGLPWPAALAAGLTAYATAVTKHDTPAITAQGPSAPVGKP